MTLLEQQFLFMRLLPRLIDAAHALDFDVSGGELQRSPEQAALNAAKGSGISKSLHIKCLAIDLKLFRGGKWLTDSAEYAALGQAWKTMHSLARWGGDFKDAKGRPKPDGGHFSLEFEGIK